MQHEGEIKGTEKKKGRERGRQRQRRKRKGDGQRSLYLRVVAGCHAFARTRAQSIERHFVCLMCTAHNALPGECVLRICVCVYVCVRMCMDGRAECDTRCHTARRGKIIAFAKQRTRLTCDEKTSRRNGQIDETASSVAFLSYY